MSDAKTIKIEITSVQKNSNNNTNKSSKNELGEDLAGFKKFLHPVDAVGELIDEKSKLWGMVFNKSVGLIVSSVGNEINRYLNLTEDYLGQDAYTNVRVAVEKTQTAASTILNGAMIGSVAGPVGAAAGAVISAASWGISQIISGRNSMSSYYQALNASNFQVGFSQTRAGLIDNGRGTEN